MNVIALQSGSNGNCVYVESGEVRLLFDAGISGRQAELRLRQHGREIRDVRALLISHDHRDHARAMGIYQRKYGLPIVVTEKTLAAARRCGELGVMGDVRHFESGSTLRFGRVRVETIRTPHDGIDGVAFVVDDGRRRVGILTDLGHVFSGLEDLVRSLDAVLLESNYDPHMLAAGPYPEMLKQRIRGPRGHLSNQQCAAVLHRACARRRRLRWACLAHLSEQNNHPQVALDTHRAVLGRHLPLCVAKRYGTTAVLEV